MIPSAKLTIEDGALGALPPDNARVQLKLGICSAGTPNTIASFSDVTAMKKALGQGPLVEALAQVLAVAGGPVLACPLTPSVAGSAGAVTHTGPGTGTVAVSLAPDRQVRAKVITGGTLTTMTVAFSVDGGEYGSPVVSGAGPWSIRVPGTLTTLTFPAGTYVATDFYTVSAATGAVTLTGTSPAGVTQASSPIDAYDVRIYILTSGALGAGVFSYSVDGGNNASAPIAIPSGGVYAIPGTGVVLTFAGTFTKDDTYQFETVAAGFVSGDVTTGITAALADPRAFGFLHVVGTPSSASAAASLAASVSAQMTAAELSFRFVFAMLECPSTESVSTINAAFAAFSSLRVGLSIGDVGLTSPLTGKTQRRNCAWAITARLSGIAMHEDAAYVRRGPVANVQSLYRDEAATPDFDEAGRFCTMRTHTGRAGYFVTNARLMAPGGSDYTYVANRRVMDRACEITRQGELPWLSGDVRVDPETGFIDERDAQAFEGEVGAALRTGILAPGHASAVEVVMSRTANLLSGATQPVTVRVVPKAYLRQIETSIGFRNPAVG